MKKKTFRRARISRRIKNPDFSKLRDILDYSNYITDNKNGLGAVPINLGIDFLGLRVIMRPKEFLKLVKISKFGLEKSNIDYIKNYIKSGGKIGSPFLNIYIPKPWENGTRDFKTAAKIISHEGRHRMAAIYELADIPVEVHLFFKTENITIDNVFIHALNSQIITENSILIYGPWFHLP